MPDGYTCPECGLHYIGDYFKLPMYCSCGALAGDFIPYRTGGLNVDLEKKKMVEEMAAYGPLHVMDSLTKTRMGKQKEAEIQSAGGRKYDTGKLRYDLIPPEALAYLAEVYTIGASKYDDRNWEKGISYSRVFAAMQRHAWAWMSGEECDPQDKQRHLASVAWCAFALMTFTERGMTEFDDRVHTVNVIKQIQEK